MHASVKRFGHTVLQPALIAGKKVLEVGALDVNGSVRQHVMLHRPAIYIGTDMQSGPGVDIKIRAEELGTIFREPTFDIVICTEMLEHAVRWYDCLRTMTRLLKFHGHLLLTTRSPGFPRHGYPDDYWRFEFEGLADVLRGLGHNVLGDSQLDPDPASPGVLFWTQRIRYDANWIESMSYNPQKVI